jgi:hypothetical protein
MSSIHGMKNPLTWMAGRVMHQTHDERVSPVRPHMRLALRRQFSTTAHARRDSEPVVAPVRHSNNTQPRRG